MTGAVALDTSAAVALVLRRHTAHARVLAGVGERVPVLTEHSQAETWSVLTRLPGDARVAPADAAAILDHTFGPVLRLKRATVLGLPALLARVGIAGGAAYDAVVGLGAKEAGLALVTRDRRALGIYAAVGVQVELL